MKNFVVESGDFITTSGIYRMNDHPGREITLIYGDAVSHYGGPHSESDWQRRSRTIAFRTPRSRIHARSRADQRRGNKNDHERGRRQML
jgi:hypothetical protein